MTVVKDPYTCVRDAHALVVCTEWDEFKHLDYTQIYKDMLKPAFAFDGRLILDHKKLCDIGFQVEVVGKSINKVYPLPLTPTLQPSSSHLSLASPLHKNDGGSATGGSDIGGSDVGLRSVGSGTM